MTNSSFVPAIQTNDAETFRSIVLQHQDMVVNTCLGIVSHLADAEDIAQDVFIEVYRSLHKFRGEAKVSTWLYRIAINRSIDFLRKKKRKSWVSSFQATFETEDKALAIADQGQRSADDYLEQQERQQVLQNAIEQLPKNQRIAFVLHKYEDLTYKEVANVMKTSVSSVESLMHRARKKLKLLLREYYQNHMN